MIERGEICAEADFHVQSLDSTHVEKYCIL